MSDPAVIVDHVLEKGGILRVSGGDLVVDAPAGSLSPATIEALRQNKPKILELVLGVGGASPLRIERNTATHILIGPKRTGARSITNGRA